MNRFSAHIGYLYTELPLTLRPAAAAADGFTAIEHPEPWEIPAAVMRSRIEDLGLTFAQVSSGMGRLGEKGLASLPGREAEFRDGFARALDYAQAVGAGFVHPMAGVGGHEGTYRANIDWALAACAGTPVKVLVEAITIPGYHLASLSQAIALQDEVGPELRLLFDSYHAAALGEDPVAWIAAHATRIGHVHMADHPGRAEPGTGIMPFEPMLNALSAARYPGAIGFEYTPSVSTSSSVAFLMDWQARLRERLRA